MRVKAQASKVFSSSIPAPIGGLNARDSTAAMPETDALILDNWFPSTTDVHVRNGSIYFASFSTHAIETIMAYNGVSTKKLFAVSSDGIYNVTVGGVIAAADVTPVTNARYQHVNMGTSGGNFLLAVNGADKLSGYNGTVWWKDGDGTHDITGFDTAKAININIFKSRVWMTEKDSSKAWYLPINSIAGAAVSFDFSSLFYLGGYLMGMTTWSVDNAAGLQEYAVFVSSEGEVLVYQGYDPSSSSTFALAAHFRIGRPIGRRFYNKVGSDVILLTADGAVPLSESLLADRSSINIAISDKIVNSITDDIASYKSNFGWQVILHPIGNKLIINVPQSANSRQYQYVMNTITKAWCTFGKQINTSGWNANCFGLYDDKLYYGSNNGIVYQCDTGNTDATSASASMAITAYAKPAFSYFKAKGQEKLFTLARPIFQLNGDVQAALVLDVDFNSVLPNFNYSSVSAGSASMWDVALWDVALWSGDVQIIKDWQTVNGIGFAASLNVGVISSVDIGWQSTDYAYQKGGIL